MEKCVTLLDSKSPIQGPLNAEDEKMMEGIDRTTAAYFLAAMKIQWSKQPEEFCGAMRCGQTGACD
jgi:hypothetical protein